MRTQQPQDLLSIDWKNPITRGLVLACPLGRDLRDVVNRTLLSVTGDVTSIGGSRGQGRSFTNSNAKRLTTALTTHATFRSYVWRARPLSAGGGGFGRVFEKTNSVSSVESVQYRTSVQSYLRGHSTTSGIWTWASALNDEVISALSYDSSSTSNIPTVYVNGAQTAVTTLVTPSGTPTTNTDPFLIGNRGIDLLREWDGLLADFLIFDRLLTDAELRSITVDPWQIFEAPRRVYKAPAGGSYATTGALSADASTIAGAAAHLTLHATSGALSSQVAAIVGTAAHLTLHATTGALAAQSATMVGTAAHEHATTGALVSDAATVNGTATRSDPGAGYATSGALAAQDSTIAGTAAHFTFHVISGALAAVDSSIAGSAVHSPLHAATGALSADPAQITGTAEHLTLHETSGALASAEATISGTALHGDQPVARVEIGGGARKHKSAKEEREEFLDEIVRETLAPAKPALQLPEPLKPVLEARPVVAKPTKPVPLSVPPSLEVADDDDKIIAALIDLGVF